MAGLQLTRSDIIGLQLTMADMIGLHLTRSDMIGRAGGSTFHVMLHLWWHCRAGNALEQQQCPLTMPCYCSLIWRHSGTVKYLRLTKKNL